MIRMMLPELLGAPFSAVMEKVMGSVTMVL